jgi:hypothetical protein
MAPGLGVDQLHVDPHPIAAALHAAFERVTHVEASSRS